MNAPLRSRYLVAVVGAGPAGLYAANELASSGAHVILINRDIKPGGLAEYGIYPNKHKMKEGLRKQFRQILDNPEIEYLGNLTVGSKAELSLTELREMGFQAILVTVGAQGPKWLGLPGEDFSGVYQAKDLVYHYNKLPPFSQNDYRIGKRVALVGVGNVMLDIANWLIRDLKVERVTAVARRGPAEVKFTKKEMEIVSRNLDLEALNDEFIRVAPVMEAMGQDIEEARNYFLSTVPKGLEPVSNTNFSFDFLASPSRIVGNELGEVRGLEVQDTTLFYEDGEARAKRLGTDRILAVDTVVFCIGDRVDEEFGLPVRWNEFVRNPTPQFPIDGISYETYDPETEEPIEKVFVAGWARKASHGLVGLARKDGENGAQAVLQFLQASADPPNFDDTRNHLITHLNRSNKHFVNKAEWYALEAVEQSEALRLGVEEFKYGSNKEMLAAIQNSSHKKEE
jgi:ferredoxin/flavodoxin---NADP+ reductase